MHVRALDLMCVPDCINRNFLPMSKKISKLDARFVLYLIYNISNRIPYQMYVKMYRFGTLSRNFS